MFSAGPFPDYTKAGVYNVSVTSLTLNGIAYSTSSITNTVASPNSFELTAVNPCVTASVTASTVDNISLQVFQASAAYSQFLEFTYVRSDSGTTDCGTFTYSVVVNLGTALNSLTTFSLNTGTKDFQVYSGNLN